MSERASRAIEYSVVESLMQHEEPEDSGGLSGR